MAERQPEPAVAPIFKWLVMNPWVAKSLKPWKDAALSIEEQSMVPVRVLSSALIECDLPAYPIAITSDFLNCAATMRTAGPAVTAAAAQMGLAAPVPADDEEPGLVRRHLHYAVIFDRQWMIDPMPTALITGSISRSHFGGHVSISPVNPDAIDESQLTVYQTPTGRVEATLTATKALKDTAFLQSAVWSDRARCRPVINQLLLALRPLALEVKRELYGLSGKWVGSSPATAAQE